MPEPRYTVLGRGAEYMAASKRLAGGGEKERFRTLPEAQTALLPQVAQVERAIRAVPPAQRLDQVIVELRLDLSYLAKSYHPKTLLGESGLLMRGAGTWQQELHKPPRGTASSFASPIGTASSRSVFASGTEQNLAKLRALIRDPSSQAMENDIIGLQAIRLPENNDRLLVAAGQQSSRIACEIVLYSWDTDRRAEAIKRITTLISRTAPGTASEVMIKEYTGGPTFIAAVIDQAAMAALAGLNFLRLARPLPRVALTRTAAGMAQEAPALPIGAPGVPTAWLTVFDGGVIPTPHLAPYVQSVDDTTRPALPGLLEHGTGVVSAALYGHIAPDKALPPVRCGVVSRRILPDPRSSDIELYGVIDTLERVVPRLPRNQRIINLSFGPAGPIDNLPSRFTYALDRMSYEYDVLFVTAVGNFGHIAGLERIQSPADSVSNLAVGAYSLEPTTGQKIPADYSCIGPGRDGCLRKPDTVAFGGSSAVPFYVLDTQANRIVGTTGTSFASPSVAAVCASIAGRVDGLQSTQSTRALLLHATSQMGDVQRWGWGRAPDTAEAALACTSTRVSVLYEGVLTPRKSWRLPFLVPPNFVAGGRANFSWTIVYCPDVDHPSLGEYTLAGVEVQMRPHARKFKITLYDPANRKPLKTRTVHLDEDAAEIDALTAAGWEISEMPITTQKKETEQKLRQNQAKWDTVIRDMTGKDADNILDPALTISILGRGEWDEADPSLSARFAAVLTVDAPKYNGDLYLDTMHAWNKLKPLTIRPDLDNRVRV